MNVKPIVAGCMALFLNHNLPKLYGRTVHVLRRVDPSEYDAKYSEWYANSWVCALPNGETVKVWSPDDQKYFDDPDFTTNQKWLMRIDGYLDDELTEAQAQENAHVHA